MRRTYLMHGYVLDSDVGLPLPELAGTAGGAAPDLTLDVEGPRPVPAQPGAGEVLAHRAGRSDEPLYTVTRSGDEVRLRFHGVAESVGDAGLRRLRA